MKILVLNGPNMNLLGLREPEIYGRETYEDLVSLAEQTCREAGLECICVQSNHEGVLIDAIHEVRRTAAGVVINAGGWTHTSVAIRDALSNVVGQVIEVHISDIHAREEFRHHSYISDVADAVIVGRGTKGYVEAVELIGNRPTR